MNESAVYNESDLAPFHRRLNELRQIVQRNTGDGKEPDALTKLLVRQLNECGKPPTTIFFRLNSAMTLTVFPISLTWFLTLFILELPRNPTDAMVRSLQDSLAVLSVELTPIHEKLVTVRRQLVALAAKEGSHKAELKPLQEELRKIDSLSAHFIYRICSFVHVGTAIIFRHSICSNSINHRSISCIRSRHYAQETGGRKIPRTQW